MKKLKLKIEQNNLPDRINQNYADKDINNTYPRLSPPGLNFTKREAECFYLLSKGITVKKMAKILGLSPRTVEMYISQLKAKMGLFYKSELIEKAIDLVIQNSNREHLNDQSSYQIGSV